LNDYRHEWFIMFLNPYPVLHAISHQLSGQIRDIQAMKAAVVRVLGKYGPVIQAPRRNWTARKKGR
jgi:hypothetical protein